MTFQMYNTPTAIAAFGRPPDGPKPLKDPNPPEGISASDADHDPDLDTAKDAKDSQDTSWTFDDLGDLEDLEDLEDWTTSATKSKPAPRRGFAASAPTAETPQGPPRRRHPDPVARMATLMVEELLAQPENGGGIALASMPGRAIVLEFCHEAWGSPLLDAWRAAIGETAVEEVSSSYHCQVVMNNRDGACDGLRLVLQSEQSPRNIGHREPLPTKISADTANLVGRLLAGGGTLWAVCCPQQTHLPADILAATDARIVFPTCTKNALGALITTFTGDHVDPNSLEGLARHVLPSDLQLSIRRGDTADAVLIRLRRQIGTRISSPKRTLDQVGGMTDAVAWGRRLATDLAAFRNGDIAWADVDRGMVLHGAPGTGKTIFAEALAGSCGVPLITASLARWQAAGHLGQLLAAMDKSFATARAAAPAILFIDEIDSLGNRHDRGSANKEYGIQVINGLLEHLDGITGREGVVVIAACNYPQRLDPALTRPGRLDRMVAISPPDDDGLEKILRLHLGADLAAEDLSAVVHLIQGETGAFCAQLVRSGKQRARIQGRRMDLCDLIAEAQGPMDTMPETRPRRAAHEAGHAMIAALLHPDALLRASIRVRGDTGGHVVINADELRLITKQEVENRLVFLLAGWAAEKLLLGAASTGCGGDDNSDLAQATLLATTAHTALGLDDSEGGLVWRGIPEAHALPTFLRMHPSIDGKVAVALQTAARRATEILTHHRFALEDVCQELLNRESLTGGEIMKILKSRTERLQPNLDSPQG